jgi:Ni,Fe-hydrogenase III large subunit
VTVGARSSPARLSPLAWRDEVARRVAAGQRFAGLYGTDDPLGTLLTALLVDGDHVDRLTTLPERERYPSLSPLVPAAFWYERALHDLSGVVPDGHPRLDPLLLRRADGVSPPHPGRTVKTIWPQSQESSGPVDVLGAEMFSLPFGPVRSGVMETIEFLLETPGEDIPHLNTRPHYKHRGVAMSFDGRRVDEGVLVAERVEGISSVAHALAYCHAVEGLAELSVPTQARLLRVVHAELERIANHLDVTLRLTDAAGLGAATARFSCHKETVMRLVSRLCGSRFGRGVVVPGGVRPPALAPASVRSAVDAFRSAIVADVAALESSASFLDRLRGTGPLLPARAVGHGALGPLGRGSGYDDDGRRHHPYDAYGQLPPVPAPGYNAGDVMARSRVRWREIETSADLIVAAVSALETAGSDLWEQPAPPADGIATGWAEAAQGEVLYDLEVHDSTVRRCFARSASFHNLLLFHDVFAGDIFTDFAFIEASFGLGYAGVAM